MKWLVDWLTDWLLITTTYYRLNWSPSHSCAQLIFLLDLLLFKFRLSSPRSSNFSRKFRTSVACKIILFEVQFLSAIQVFWHSAHSRHAWLTCVTQQTNPHNQHMLHPAWFRKSHFRQWHRRSLQTYTCTCTAQVHTFLEPYSIYSPSFQNASPSSAE